VDPAHEILQQAAAFLAADDYPSARRRLALAATLDPSNPDHRIGLAHTYIREENLTSALTLYDSVLRDWPDHAPALVLRAVYGELADRSTQSAEDWRRLLDRHSGLGRRWQRIHALARSRETMPLTADIPQVDSPRHGLVVLGHQLREDGGFSPELRARLDLALAAARRNPAARLILSGGVKDHGGAEAQAMRAWLTEQGVDRERLLLEELSIDTIENALFSVRLAAAVGIDQLTVISSAAHSARAAALFDAADESRGHDNLSRVSPAHHLSAGLSGVPEVALRLYRDVLRLGGLWAIPGYRR
jgi:tetratricopeptide (TPR) repeat protein